MKGYQVSTSEGADLSMALKVMTADILSDVVGALNLCRPRLCETLWTSVSA